MYFSLKNVTVFVIGNWAIGKIEKICPVSVIVLFVAGSNFLLNFNFQFFQKR
jgi:hypothetical protein